MKEEYIGTTPPAIANALNVLGNAITNCESLKSLLQFKKEPGNEKLSNVELKEKLEKFREEEEKIPPDQLFGVPARAKELHQNAEAGLRCVDNARDNELKHKGVSKKGIEDSQDDGGVLVQLRLVMKNVPPEVKIYLNKRADNILKGGNKEVEKGVNIPPEFNGFLANIQEKYVKLANSTDPVDKVRFNFAEEVLAIIQGE